MYQMQLLIRRQLTAAWRYRWPAIMLCWLVCAGGYIAVMRLPNTYEASARMYIDADAILTPLLRGLSVDTSLQSQVELLSRTLLSRPSLDKLISNTDLELQAATTTDKENLETRLANDIKIVPQTRNLFLISYRDQSAKLAYDVVQQMLAAFQEGKSGNNRQDIDNASKFINTQLDLYERQLRDTERRRAEFRTKYLDLLPGDGGASGLDNARTTVKTLTGQLEDAQARRIALAKELAGTPPLLVTDNDSSPAAAAASRVEQAEQQLRELQLRLTDAHPDVIAQKQLIAALKAGKLGRDTSQPTPSKPAAPGSRAVPNPVYEQLKVRLVETDTNISSLQRQLADATKERERIEAIAKNAPGLQAEAINLDRDYGILRTNYDALLSRRESMRISAAAEMNSEKAKLQVIDPPILPRVPIAPARAKLLTGVLVAGLGAGLGLALLLVQLDQSFHSTDDLRNLGYPVVGGISLLGATIPFFRRAVTIGVFAIAIILPCVVYGGLVMQLVRSGMA